MKTYQPKGGMCCNCKNASHDCSGLQFDKMQPIEKHGELIIVRCAAWERAVT